MKFIIIDWASNVLFNGKEFDDFEDAWGFLYETFPDEDEFDDYDVIEKTIPLRKHKLLRPE